MVRAGLQLIVDGLRFSYQSSEVLKGVSFELNDHEILGVIGPNGSGKTTLLKCINMVLKPKQGLVLFDGNDVKRMERLDVAKIFGYVPQNAQLTFDTPTVFECVLMGRRPYVSWRCSPEDFEKTWSALAALGIERFAMRRLSELSSGEQQKVLIARALAQEAKVLLLDEPTSNLDIKHQLEVMNIMKDLVIFKGLSAIVAIHDLNLASIYCDKLLLLREGEVVAVGKPKDVLTVERIKDVYGVDVDIEIKDDRVCITVLPNSLNCSPSNLISVNRKKA